LHATSAHSQLCFVKNDATFEYGLGLNAKERVGISGISADHANPPSDPRAAARPHGK
jgi:hypothetical protein